MVDARARRRAGMRDVALAARVSVSTVANVLSRPRVVAEGTRLRVEQAIEDVGYVPGGPSRRPRGSLSPVVGSIVLDLANPFYGELNRGLEHRLAQAGCFLLAGSTDLRPEKERQLLDLLLGQSVRGLVVSPSSPDPGPLLEVSRRGTPVVLVDAAPAGAGLCAVSVDHGLGGRLAARHLLSLGHRRIAFLTGAADPGPVASRREGLRQGVAEAGLDPDRVLFDVRLPRHTRKPLDEAAAAVGRLLAVRPRPTAVVCVNDAAAITVLEVLDRAGLRVPDDISLVGYDDLPFAERLAPALTTVAQPKRELGEAAAELLLDEPRPGHEHREVRFAPTLVVRGSTGPA